MPIPRHQTTCIEKKLIARDVYELRFTKPSNWAFKSGQFVLLDVPLVEDALNVQTRAYSLASESIEDDILYVLKLKAGGRSSRWVDEVVQPGTTTTMQGPFGTFVLPEVSQRDYLFLATSTGLAPFRAQIKELLRRNERVKIDLLLGVRSMEDLFWNDFFRDLAKINERFTYHLALSAPHEDWIGHTGRIQPLVPKLFPDIAERTIYACGNPDMTKDVKSLALTQWGLQKQDIHVEGYI